jgi:hypothetical protein
MKLKKKIRGGNVQLNSVLTRVFDGGEWKLRSGRSIPGKKNLVFFECYSGWASEAIRTLWRRGKCLSLRGFGPRYLPHIYPNCTVPGVRLRNTFGSKAATCCIWQRKWMHCGLGCRENLYQLGYCHLLKADCAVEWCGNCKGLAHGSSWALSKPAANISSCFMRCLSS